MSTRAPITRRSWSRSGTTRSHLLAGAALLVGLLATGACTSATNTPQASNQPSPSATLVSDGDASWIKQAHQGNLAEIEAGTIAEQKGTTAEVRAVGKQMVTDHTNLDMALQRVANPLGVALDSKPDSEQQALGKRYAAASGTAFDQLFVTTQVTAHQQALAAAREEVSDGSAAAAKQAAQSAEPVISSHIQMLQQAEQGLGTPMPSAS